MSPCSLSLLWLCSTAIRVTSVSTGTNDLFFLQEQMLDVDAKTAALKLQCRSTRNGEKLAEHTLQLPLPWRELALQEKNYGRKGDIPCQVARSVDDDAMLYLTMMDQDSMRFLLIKMVVDLDKGEFIAETAVDLPLLEDARRPGGMPLFPTALMGFRDGRVFVGYCNKVVVADVASGASKLLHDFADGPPGKQVDAFAWNGNNTVVAVDNFEMPKWMFVFDLSAGRVPGMLERVDLPSGINEIYRHAVFRSDTQLVIWATHGHLGGHGNSLLPVTVEPAGTTVAHALFEHEDRDDGKWSVSFAGNITDWGNLQVSANGELVVPAHERGLLVIPGNATAAGVTSSVRRVETRFAAVDAVCRNNHTVALLREKLESVWHHHVAVLDEDFTPRLSASLPEFSKLVRRFEWQNLYTSWRSARLL
eukprot:TRINITY_DN81466_c0_g1_i1.p1 TRINITY_DN81466_c0_g1~~TRINITY_DN81466_c0_g1_i1.p1  ORF type:complete len:420 (+),score=52.49 TRINITY_DN81466_c0_g1_i1:56-1315(+)